MIWEDESTVGSEEIEIQDSEGVSEESASGDMSQDLADEEMSDESGADEGFAETDEEQPVGDGADGDEQGGRIAELNDRLMRQMAEFDNYRKRTEKEKIRSYEIGASDFILKLLPVVDNFERGMEALGDDERESSFVQGIEMIYKQLRKLLEDEGVTEIAALGELFDPAFHNAVMQQESDEYESGHIMQVMQKGYMYRDKVLRHSMVVVAQ